VGPDKLIYFMGGGNTAYNTGGLVGGQEFYADVFVYSMFNSTWIDAVDLPYGARYGMSTASPDGTIWFFGGNSNTVVYDRVSTLEIMRITVTMSSGTTVQGGGVLIYVDPQFAYLNVLEYYVNTHVQAPSGFSYESQGFYVAGDWPFAMEVTVPSVAETGLHLIVVDYFVAYVDGWYNVELPMADMALTVEAAAVIEDMIADLETQLADLKTALVAQGADIDALQAQIDALEAQITALQTALAGLGTGFDAVNDRIDTLENKADSANMWGMVTMILVVVVLVLLVLMFLMGRKKAA
jgi:prefoldin subunit 5